MVEDRPKLARDPRVGEAVAKVTERKASGETGDGDMDAAEARREVEGGRQGKGERAERERRSCSA
jgi:hypothetical protein